jgi:hypothetical protein
VINQNLGVTLQRLLLISIGKTIEDFLADAHYPSPRSFDQARETTRTGRTVLADVGRQPVQPGTPAVSRGVGTRWEQPKTR